MEFRGQIANYPHLVHLLRLNLYEFAAWGQDLVSIVRFRKGPYYRGFLEEMYEDFVAT